MAVASFESGLDSARDLVGLGLPGTEADGGDGLARVELEGLAGGESVRGQNNCKDRGTDVVILAEAMVLILAV